MMFRSLGAGKFSTFWKYWDLIWGYYLGKCFFKPVRTIFPTPLSLILTFLISGFLHDIVITLIRWDFTLVFTPWFLIMSIWVVVGDFINLGLLKVSLDKPGSNKYFYYRRMFFSYLLIKKFD
jgi:hypothetical protein